MATLGVLPEVANTGYLSLKLEAAKGTPLTPDTEVPLYSEDIVTNLNIDEDNPIIGINEARYNIFRGQEDYQGVIRVLAEPKTVPHFFNMLLKKGTEGGGAAAGYIHPFTLDTPDSYTIEFNKRGIPFRFFGVEAKSIRPVFEENKMILEVAISALGQFSIARIKSATAGGSNYVVLDEAERLAPSDGLVVGDYIRLYDVSAGTYEDAELTAIGANKKTLTVATLTGSYEEGDFCWLKPMTPSYSLSEPFNWGQTEFCFGADAAAALAATQERIEKGSDWNIMHMLEEDAGAKRSGKYRPEALVRKQGDVEITLKKFFKDGAEQNRFLHRLDRALVIRHFSPTFAGSNLVARAEIRLTINKYFIKENTTPLSSDEIIYNNLILAPIYKTGETQMFDLKVINDQAGATYE